jgi:glycine/D-amino acid oxidase-like deaminating enzyme
MAHHLFDFLHDFYPKLEKRLGASFFFPMPLQRIFISQKQVNDWHGQLSDSDIKEFLKEQKLELPVQIDAPLGYVDLTQTGYVDVSIFIKAMRKKLLQNNQMVESVFDFDLLDPEKGSYDHQIYDHIIFCEGAEARNNPFFGYLPLVPNKGEILEIEVETLPNDRIYNKNGFLMPKSKDIFWAGATYHKEDTSRGMSDQGKEQLQERLKLLGINNYTIKRGITGIRPTVKDRRPLIGIHPRLERIAIFNGLGSKGVSLAPYWASALADHFLEQKTISPEVNIDRYVSLF